MSNIIYYTLYNENLLELNQVYRLKHLFLNILDDSESYILICKGILNPDEKIVNFNHLHNKIINNPEIKIITHSKDELLLKYKYDKLKIEELINILTSFANIIIVKLETDENETNYKKIMNQYEQKIPFYKSKYNLEYYINIIKKGIFINNIQHYINIGLHVGCINEINYIEKYCINSNDYNFGLTPLKEYK